ncbi:MAG: response regulator transcription factor [Bacteroidales bacterium]|nr:response regulator transcription factor [Bacteroidales bacterium]
MKILIVEDEELLLNTLKDFLSGNNYVCEIAENFHKAEDKIAVYHYDIVLLDITLPYGNGLELIKTIKALHPDTGIIVISARNSLDDKLKGLDLGADDYLTKPFHLPELNSRIKALLRRRKTGGTDYIKFNELSISIHDRELKVKDAKLEMTRKEYDLLLFFVTNKSRVLTKESIAEHLWGDYIDALDNFDFIYTHIKNIRKKLEASGSRNYIKTVYGMGYKFTDE